MSYDLFVQRFENGDAAAMDGIAFRAVWGPYVDRTEPEFDLWHFQVDDGGGAEIYGGVAGETFDSLVISRFSPGRVLDLLVEFAAAADAVVMPPGCPTLLVREDQRRHLPEELRADAVIVRGGADVERILDEN
ncbi:hypothetical protein Val02_63050 [Virgisporangium aliadipatigenens]|uniref:Uncharacterized protein n=1 Tax=Virgisporangium aliadipatigenens TaxID=741659 RepID=A0A8J4DT48_9ACTN|nr:hypothetical protein [Virgisporangium aliadipatigenens]GIJ49419.1 hypothetical protein Val02_63050 [Virgisporangium aliadipatigenens]